MRMPMEAMAGTARNIVEQVLAIRPGEKVCILTDIKRSPRITRLLAASARAAGGDTVVVTIAPRGVGGVDPPPPAAAALQAAQVLIGQASYGILHTETVREALRRGARICDMWGFNENMMVHGGATADYQEVSELSHRLAQILTAGREACLTTPEGTALTLSLRGRQARVLAGQAREPGQFCAFPDGEAAIAPLEGTARGLLVDPFCVEQEGLGFLKEGLSLTVEKGKVVEIQGGKVARQLLRELEALGESTRNIAELGIGTNRQARPGVTVRETKKAWGTAHVALGDSKSLGGTVESPLHLDLVFRQPTLVVDGQTLLEQGKVLL